LPVLLLTFLMLTLRLSIKSRINLAVEEQETFFVAQVFCFMLNYVLMCDLFCTSDDSVVLFCSFKEENGIFVYFVLLSTLCRYA